MHRKRFDMLAILENYAVRFEACTTRAESDQEMRKFLSVVHYLAGVDRYSIDNSGPRAMSQMSRIIAAWERFQEK